MVAAAVVGSAVLGGALSSSASRSAAKTQAAAADRATAVGDAQFQQTRQDMTPWRQAGEYALAQINNGTNTGQDFNRDFTLGDFQRDPGYQFRQSEGMAGVEGSAAARGGLLNGGTLRALDRYNQEFASGEYSNAYNRFNADRDRRFNRLSSVAGIGQTATRDVSQAGQANAQQAGNNIMQAANARASGYMGQANAINNTAQNMGNMYMQQQTMNRLFPAAAGGGAAQATSTPWAGGNSAGSVDIG